LEVDLERPADMEHLTSRVQLPEASLRGMRQLMASLKQPQAVAVRKGSAVSQAAATPLLMEQLGAALSEAALTEVKASLHKRVQECAKSQSQMWETSSQGSEALAQALPSQVLDISICCVDSASGVTLALSRLPAGSFCSFGALLVCCEPQLDAGRDVARALPQLSWILRWWTWQLALTMRRPL